MSYSDQRQQFDPRAFAITIGGMGLFLTAMATLGAGIVMDRIIDNPMTVINMDPPPKKVPPPQPQPTPQGQKSDSAPTIITPKPQVDLQKPVAPAFPTTPTETPGTGGNGLSPFDPTTRFDPVPTPIPPVKNPVLTKAQLDSRAVFQPTYPSGRIRAEQSGEVKVRITIGTDGRVTGVEKISATHDDFFEATKRQALSKWRFKPATRDGVPYETTMVMTVRFNLADL